jgi:GAF domain-containing protein
MSGRSAHSRHAAQIELETVKRRMAALEAAHADCAARIRDLHERNTDLVRLTVAGQRLASSVQRDEILSTIEEIVVDLIGSEELAIFELPEVDGDADSLHLVHIRGIAANIPRLAPAAGPIRYALGVGQTLVARSRRRGADDVDGGLTAAIPLKLDGHVTGAIAIFGLVEHKDALAPVDHELFEVLSRQAAMALHSAASRAQRPTVRPPPRPSE